MNRRLFTKSIKGRLLLWMAGVLTLILTGLGVTVYEIRLARHGNRLDDELRRRVAALGAALYTPPAHDRDRRTDGPPDDDFGPPPPPGEFSGRPPGSEARHGRRGLAGTKLPAAVATLFEEHNPAGFYFVVWQSDFARPVRQSANAPAGVVKPPPGGMITAISLRTRGPFREAFHATDWGDCELVGCSTAPETAGARRLAGWLLLGGASVLALVLGGAGWLIGRALLPVNKISAAALKISSGDLTQRISVAETESELGRLAAVLNATFTRLETSFAQQKQFTCDAAHELRTPLAVLISETQTILSRARSPADYRDSLTACLATAQKMRRLTESLLELARLDAGQENLRRDKINLAALALEGVELIRPLAAARHLQIFCDLAPVEVLGDATRLAEVVTNLLTNAINYNRTGGEIRVATREAGGAAVLTVADTGCGIPAADLPRVFERFYRADQSRSTGGSGLGLAICQAIITAHGGAIEVASEVNAGAAFTVRLPGLDRWPGVAARGPV